jgi:hypothetical protein
MLHHLSKPRVKDDKLELVRSGKTNDVRARTQILKCEGETKMGNESHKEVRWRMMAIDRCP